MVHGSWTLHHRPKVLGWIRSLDDYGDWTDHHWFEIPGRNMKSGMFWNLVFSSTGLVEPVLIRTKIYLLSFLGIRSSDSRCRSEILGHVRTFLSEYRMLDRQSILLLMDQFIFQALKWIKIVSTPEISRWPSTFKFRMTDLCPCVISSIYESIEKDVFSKLISLCRKKCLWWII